MAKHYYNVEVKTDWVIDEEDAQDLENQIRLVLAGFGDANPSVTIEYVDSEG